MFGFRVESRREEIEMKKDNKNKIKLTGKEIQFLPILILTVASEPSKSLPLKASEKLSDKYPIFGNVNGRKILDYSLQENLLGDNGQNHKYGRTESFFVTKEGKELIELSELR